jgi:hypothetical protein
MANRPDFVCVWLGLAKIGQKSAFSNSFMCLHGQQARVCLCLVGPLQNQSEKSIILLFCGLLCQKAGVFLRQNRSAPPVQLFYIKMEAIC